MTLSSAITFVLQIHDLETLGILMIPLSQSMIVLQNSDSRTYFSVSDHVSDFSL